MTTNDRQMFTATYSPEDNKLRLYSASRLDADTYARVRAAGFSWAPKQELFVAPAWTPERADLLEELAGDIGDEDTSLADRAEERAERFENYSERRAIDAERARYVVDAISGGIPLGQPILVGHHSERHARKDAERIENGMRRAVKMWETSKYWESRAAGAIQHAKYKELPAVRARRIRGLEADLRKVTRTLEQVRRGVQAWSTEPLTREAAMELANYCHISQCFPLSEYPRSLPASQYEGSIGLWSALGGSSGEEAAIITPAQAASIVIRELSRSIERCERWIQHYTNRLVYERAMLAEGGGLASDRFDFKPGGQIRRRGVWLVVLKVNAQSVTVAGHFARTVSFDEIQDYRPPTEEAAKAVAKVVKLPPLCNYPGEGFRHMTKAELAADKSRKWSDFPKTGRIKATDKYGAHRVQQTRGASPFSVVGVYVTDQKRTDPPAPESEPRPDLKPQRAHADPKPIASKPAPTAFDAMKESLRAGVQVVSAHQLFPTPPEIARRVVDLANIQAGNRVLEPSAGTGSLLEAISSCPAASLGVTIQAVEINRQLADGLCRFGCSVRCADFLACNGDLGTFDRIVMNPPFERGADIEHIRHALGKLRPGGRLVAICAAGPRQRAAFESVADAWENLPGGSFASAGTGVSTAIVVLTRGSEAECLIGGAA